jgi:uncharacterized membrane protein
LIVEIVCLALFLAAALLRAQNPQINGIEKFMDSAILNGLLRTRTGTPKDVWYVGHSINYYYFGHWLVAMAAKLSGTDGARAFTLGFATVVATAGTSLFVAGWTLARRFVGGLLVLFLAFIASNLHPFLSIFIKHQANYFFFNSGRFTQYRINEYPLYSFSLGDLHAHMLSLILTTAFVLFVILYIKNKKFVYSNAAIMGGLLGLMAATNSFDTLSCGFLAALVLLARWYRTPTHSQRSSWQPAAFVCAGAVLPLLVFLSTFKQPTGGIGFAAFQVPVGHILMQFAGPFIVLLIAGISHIRTRPVTNTVTFNDRIKNLDEDSLLLMIFGVVAATLILAPELVFVKDIYFYTNPPYKLANTEFKVWYTGWILLAITAGASFVRTQAIAIKRHHNVVIASCVGLTIVCAILLVGTVKGIAGVQDSLPPTINGLSYLKIGQPDKYSVATWANLHIKGQPTVLEASGDSYSQNDWFSAYTGLPTIIGWRSHEWGWRYSATEWNTISGKASIVHNIYASTSAASLRQQVTANHINYVLLGPDEVSAYGAQATVFMQAFGQPVYQAGSIAIYRTAV